MSDKEKSSPPAQVSHARAPSSEEARGAAEKQAREKKTPTRASHKQLAKEVAQWEDGELKPQDWEDAPAAVPRSSETKAISMRIPVEMLEILKAFASRSGVGYQVLIKRWLDDRIKKERIDLRRQKNRARQKTATPPPVHGLEDRSDYSMGHYVHRG